MSSRTLLMYDFVAGGCSRSCVAVAAAGGCVAAATGGCCRVLEGNAEERTLGAELAGARPLGGLGRLSAVAAVAVLLLVNRVIWSLICNSNVFILRISPLCAGKCGTIKRGKGGEGGEGRRWQVSAQASLVSSHFTGCECGAWLAAAAAVGYRSSSCCVSCVCGGVHNTTTTTFLESSIVDILE